MEQGRVFWITGLSGSGKTTLCSALVEHIRNAGESIIMFDGDVLRYVFGMTDGYSREERTKVSLRYSRLVHSIVAQGVDVAIATISMYEDVYAWNRENFDRYVEIYLDVPMDELVRRDPKGIYRRAIAGDLKHVAGMDLVVDRPISPHIHLEWSPNKTVQTMLSEIVNYLEVNNAE
ncbi:adenylyl-sulfate kinase [Micavibrio aeruginosavorus]|uniref:Adenylylsulfate kinase family protein n=1 Tax=Micavibrio aeruginosavorus (strain ARL-13) TaxID=856793 RepID=G2KLW1_MICAA|nr:adenylyl-sulfate kinase [Micavibrio aeruginosavorus]AEP09340.1 adenylylsulfate kinase family protein [Micavibrio aeruginosavorus ARL-13]